MKLKYISLTEIQSIFGNSFARYVEKETKISEDGEMLFSLNEDGLNELAKQHNPQPPVTNNKILEIEQADPLSLFIENGILKEELVYYITDSKDVAQNMINDIINQMYIKNMILQSPNDPDRVIFNPEFEISSMAESITKLTKYLIINKIPYELQNNKLFELLANANKLVDPQAATEDFSGNVANDSRPANYSSGFLVSPEILKDIIQTDNNANYNFVLQYMINKIKLFKIINDEIRIDSQFTNKSFKTKMQQLKSFASRKRVLIDDDKLKELFRPFIDVNSIKDKYQNKKTGGKPPRTGSRMRALLIFLLSATGITGISLLINSYLKKNRFVQLITPDVDPALYENSPETFMKRFQLFNSTQGNRFQDLAWFDEIPGLDLDNYHPGSQKRVVYDKVNNDLCLYYIDQEHPWGNIDLIFKPLRPTEWYNNIFQGFNNNDPVKDIQHPLVKEALTRECLYQDPKTGDIWQVLPDEQSIVRKYECLQQRKFNPLAISSGLYTPDRYIEVLDQNRKGRPNETYQLMSFSDQVVRANYAGLAKDLISPLNKLNSSNSKYRLEFSSIDEDIFAEFTQDGGLIINLLITAGYLTADLKYTEKFEALQSSQQLLLPGINALTGIDQTTAKNLLPSLNDLSQLFTKEYHPLDVFRLFGSLPQKMSPLENPDLKILRSLPEAEQEYYEQLAASYIKDSTALLEQIYLTLKLNINYYLIVQGSVPTADQQMLSRYLTSSAINSLITSSEREMTRILNSDYFYTLELNSGQIIPADKSYR